MHQPSYLTDISSWYLVGQNEQNIDRKVSKEYLKSIFTEEKLRIANIVRHLHIDKNIISFVEHHLAHLVCAAMHTQSLKK